MRTTNQLTSQVEEAALNALGRAHKVPVPPITPMGKSRWGVLGDTRAANVLVRTNGSMVDVRFVDFDWAGLVGRARYPSSMNHWTLVWPKGVEESLQITAAKDKLVLRGSFKGYT
ncbi:hypothetical protein WJX73_004874 [Symbiochloris irregularis]|uniref:Aminoglycoside phosphotransferase domain-containing protein n=1 Tax=Symbiochloris irregularis TaxID=706552 RepID=A0AAW1NXL6_9CHLO